MRADFNADNAKLDAAILALNEKMTTAGEDRCLVASVTPEAGTTLIHLPLDGLDRTKWSRLVLYGRLYGSGIASLYLNNNRRSGSVLNCLGSSPGVTDVHANLYCAPSGGRAFFRVEFDLRATYVWCQFFSAAHSTGSASGSFGASMDRSYAWSSVTELTIATPSLSSGSGISLWAER